MLDYHKALEIMLSADAQAKVEHRPLGECLGRVVAEAVTARIALPPFSKAAMDGFAVSRDDGSDGFEIIEEIPAGGAPKKTVSRGTCSRIMTGAMMPAGADRVIRVEFTAETDGRMRIETPETGDNVIGAGENVAPGEIIFEPGIVRPQNIGIFAEQGIDTLPVREPPLVAVIATGSELKDPGDKLAPGQIYNSNGLQLCAQVSAMGARPKYYGIVEDKPAAVAAMLEDAVSTCDVVMLSGGVSMGDYDYVPPAVEQIGGEILFHKVAVKPGKPLLFARRGPRYIVGLPGNPVSTFIIFEVMVKRLLYRLMGIDTPPQEICGRLTTDIRRRDTTRFEFRPVVVSGDAVSPVSYHGSSHLRALGSANALLTIEPGVNTVTKGTNVYVRPL
jgi:molybdopterin molybdotransferase